MTENLVNAVSAFPEKWTLIIAALIIIFVALVGLVALIRSGKGGE